MNIPQEIIDQIVSYLPDQVSYVKAALVNKAWNYAATSMLYRHISMEFMPGNSHFGDMEYRGMYNVCLALAKNPYTSSVVQSLLLYFDQPQANTAQQQEWEASLSKIRSLLKEVIARNGLPRVRKLTLLYPDLQIAHILLKGLLPQIHSLQVVSPAFKNLYFECEEATVLNNLQEVEFQFTQDISRRGAGFLFTGEQLALSQEWKIMEDKMYLRVNGFLFRCPSLQVLKITGTKELHTLLQSVHFPSLKTLEIGQVFSHQIDFAVICLNSFLERHPTITRLALSRLPDGSPHSFILPKESVLNIREFISCIEEVPSDYLSFIRQFQQLETFRLEHHMIVGSISHREILELLPELQHHKPGIKNLTLPMPTHISGWTLTDEKRALARSSLVEFGTAFAGSVPAVEKFGISQIGRFDMEASEWAQALSFHNSLRHFAIKMSFLPTISVHEPASYRQGLINDIARSFSAVPKLETVVFFESLNQQAVKVTIQRLDHGVVEGIEELISVEDVNEEFFDEFFDSGW
ncbi:hypothetical protein DFP73DRAFT_123812 [Morchella snyderi]|nr:hypothetical protein DFP73DRAFT_123812 [Morchella snyderi]